MAGRHSVVRFFISGEAAVEVRLTRGSRTIRNLKASYKRIGRKSVDLRSLKRGRYRIVISAQGPDGYSVDHTTVVVR